MRPWRILGGTKVHPIKGEGSRLICWQPSKSNNSCDLTFRPRCTIITVWVASFHNLFMIIHTSYLLWCDLALVETWTGDVSIDKQDTEQTSITDPNDMNGINNINIVALYIVHLPGNLALFFWIVMMGVLRDASPLSIFLCIACRKLITSSLANQLPSS